MPLDPINPIGPRSAARPGEIPGVRRVDSATDRRQGEGSGAQQKRERREAEPAPEPPPDDGRPHIDVRA